MGATSEHFTNAELQCHCGCNRNECTQTLVDALEVLRALLGRPIRIDSAYRCPEHNAALPNAAKHSQHELGNAADIVIEGLTPQEMETLAAETPAFRGIGRADHQGYIHVDVRPQPDPKARWCYDPAGNECPWYPSVPQAGGTT